MSERSERQPLGRLRVIGVALAALAGLALLIAGVSQLRHPPVVEPAPTVADAGDPREPIVCPDEPAGQTPRVSSDDLYECPRVYDGALVRYEGEAVGALLRRNDGAWAQLNDDAYAGDLGPLPAHRDFRGGNAGMGVHLPPGLADQVTWVGGPSAQGDVLEVIAKFHHVDADSGEVAVLRAREGRVVRPGHAIQEPVLPDRRVVGALVALATAGLLIAEPLLRRRRRR